MKLNEKLRLPDLQQYACYFVISEAKQYLLVPIKCDPIIIKPIATPDFFRPWQTASPAASPAKYLIRPWETASPAKHHKQLVPVSMYTSPVRSLPAFTRVSLSARSSPAFVYIPQSASASLLAYEHPMLLRELYRMKCEPQIHDLLKIYVSQMERIENQRQQALSSLNASVSPGVNKSVNGHFDQQRLQLVHSTRAQVLVIRVAQRHMTSLSTAQRAQPQQNHEQKSPRGLNDSAYHSQSSSPESSSSPPDDSTYRLTRRRLNKVVIETLEMWYQSHAGHPYLSTNQEAEHLAETCGITVTQLRKWLANRRTRAGNTHKCCHQRTIKKLQGHGVHPYGH